MIIFNQSIHQSGTALCLARLASSLPLTPIFSAWPGPRPKKRGHNGSSHTSGSGLSALDEADSIQLLILALMWRWQGETGNQLVQNNNRKFAWKIPMRCLEGGRIRRHICLSFTNAGPCVQNEWCVVCILRPGTEHPVSYWPTDLRVVILQGCVQSHTPPNNRSITWLLFIWTFLTTTSIIIHITSLLG